METPINVYAQLDTLELGARHVLVSNTDGQDHIYMVNALLAKFGSNFNDLVQFIPIVF